MAARSRFFGVMTTTFLLTACAGVPRAVTVAPAQPAGQKTETVPFVATEALRKKTFDEVSQVIDDLDGIIARSDFDQWRSYLTDDYARSRGSPDFLAKASSAAVLKKNGIVLKNLKDYFDDVVVRSRQQVTLSDIEFVDATHVKAYTRVQGTLYILYYLVHEDDRWKIGVLPSGES
jgi:hypothetical protein